MILNNGKFILAICFVLSMLSVSWYLKRKKKRMVSWSTFAYSGHVFFLGIIIYVLYSLAYYSVTEYYPNREFTKKEWQDNIEKRYEFYKDLTRNKKDLILYKGEDGIIEQLGPPMFRNDSTIYYYLGITPSLFAIDPELLVIQFDENKKSFNFFKRRQS